MRVNVVDRRRALFLGRRLRMHLRQFYLCRGQKNRPDFGLVRLVCQRAFADPIDRRAIGVSEELAHTSLRFSLGRFTTESEVDYAIAQCQLHVERLREMSPLWEMVQEGIDISSIQWSQEDGHHH